MDHEQRLIVCCNYRALNDETKGQAIALFEKDNSDSRYYTVNEKQYFCDESDMEVHIVPNRDNSNSYSDLEAKYLNKLYEIQCVEVDTKNIESTHKSSRNKSNLYKIDGIEPKAICEVIESELPDEVDPVIIVKNMPLTRHIFIRNEDFTYGPFEFDTIKSEDNTVELRLKKPSDTKYLGLILRRLSILKYNNSDLESNYKIINLPSKSFNHAFLVNVSDLRNIQRDTENYGFLDELEKAVSVIIKESNTKGITKGQVAILSQRLRSKRQNFNFDGDYVLNKLNDAVKFDKVLESLKSDLKDALIDQAIKGNEDISKHFIASLKNDNDLIAKVKEELKDKQTELLNEVSKINDDKALKEAELKELKVSIAEVRVEKAELDDAQEQAAIEKLRQEHTDLINEIEQKKVAKQKIEKKFSDIFKFDDIKDELDKVTKELEHQKTVYSIKYGEVLELEKQVEGKKTDLVAIQEESADEYKRQLLSVKHSIEALTQFDDGESTHSFNSIPEPKKLNNEVDLVNYIKYIQVLLADNDRLISVEQLINLLVCIDISFITILSGLPGTGKTSLATLLGNEVTSSRFNSIQVGRGWTSERDLMGYYNPITNKYVSSATGMYEYLKGLETDKRLNLVLLDEANLSPIEHYWSKFMGLTDNFIGKEVRFSNNNNIKLTNNLRFIATINNDITTEPLSPRLLDRAPCIRLDVFTAKDNGNTFGIDTLDDELKLLLTNQFIENPIDFSSFQSLSAHYKLSEKELDEINGFTDTIDAIKDGLLVAKNAEKNLGTRIHLSERRMQMLHNYLATALGIYKQFTVVAPDWIENENSKSFLDFAIAQFILPLINGHGKNFRNRLELVMERISGSKLESEGSLNISKQLLTSILIQGEEDLDTYDFMSLR